MRNWILRDHSDDTLIEAIERNIIEQNIYFASKHPHMDVLVEDEFILVDTHTPFYWHNGIFTTKFISEEAKEKIAKLLSYFKEKNRSFLWMIGPMISEEEVSSILKDFGLKKLKKMYCMVINLSHFKKRQRYIRGLHLQQVLSKRSLHDFKQVIKEHYCMHEETEEYFQKLSHLTFHISDPKKLFVGYLNEKVAITGELYLGAGIAGLSICLNRAFLGNERDLIIDISAKMLSQAKHQGYHYAIVKSPKEHCYFYHQLGFKKYCQFSYYH